MVRLGVPRARAALAIGAVVASAVVPVTALAAWPDAAAFAIGSFSLFCLAVGGFLLRAGLSRS